MVELHMSFIDTWDAHGSSTTSGWFCKSQIHESDVHFLCSLSTKKDDACNETQQQIHDGDAQHMKVKPTLNKLRKLVTPPNALDPIYTFFFLIFTKLECKTFMFSRWWI